MLRIFSPTSGSARRPVIGPSPSRVVRRRARRVRTRLMVALVLLLGGCATGTIPPSHEDRHVVIGHDVDGPRTLLLQPVSGARLSSTFGPRRDPFTGDSTVHNGVDYAASVGTPVRAAGDGIVVSAGRRGAYGHYVHIRHDDRHETAYGHLSGYVPRLARGVRVRQDEIIGYVGSSGRSTGPHLHYEVLADGVQVDPFALETSLAQAIKGRAVGAAEAVRDAASHVRDRVLATAGGVVDVVGRNIGSIGGGEE